MSTPWSNEPTLPGVVATWREVYEHRRFLSFLGVKSIKKQYARTMLGWSWLLITPLVPVLLQVLVFGALVGLSAEGVPYFLFVTLGTLPWNVFAGALMWSTRGLEMHRGVLQHVYVPRVILPIATMTPSLFYLLIFTVVTIGVVAYYLVTDGTTHLSLGAHTVWAVAALVLVMVFALGIGLFTSVWGETARDARFTLATVLQVWFIATPVLYPVSLVAVQYQPWLVLNPMASFVEAFKYGFFGVHPPDPWRFGISTAVTLVVLSLGLTFFARRMEAEETVDA